MGSKDKGKREAKKPKKDKKAKPVATTQHAVIPPSTHQRPGGEHHT